MRVIVGAAFFAWAASPAFAIECSAGTPDFLVMENWSAEPAQHFGRPASLVYLHFKNTADQGVRLIDAGYTLHNVLGRRIGPPLLLPSSIQLDAGAVATFDFVLPGTEILDANPDDIIVTICTRSVVYDDGTVERFD